MLLEQAQSAVPYSKNTGTVLENNHTVIYLLP